MPAASQLVGGNERIGAAELDGGDRSNATQLRPVCRLNGMDVEHETGGGMGTGGGGRTGRGRKPSKRRYGSVCSLGGILPFRFVQNLNLEPISRSGTGSTDAVRGLGGTE